MCIYLKHISWWIFHKLNRLAKLAPRSKTNITNLRRNPPMFPSSHKINHYPEFQQHSLLFPLFIMYTNGIIQQVLFCTFLLSIFFVRFTLLLHIPVDHSFSVLYKSPWSKYVTIYLYTLPLIDIWIISSLIWGYYK